MPVKTKVIIISGPTATGKTGLAVSLALRLGGEIINADSMQVYRHMDIGTAKPTEDERKGVLHHLLDVVNPNEPFNAALFRQMALPLAKKIAASETPCFIVGGTGLYIRALLGGLVDLPPVDQTFRDALKREWDQLGGCHLHKRLKRLDPQSAISIHPNDKTRIIRCLEIIHQTSRPCSEKIHGHGFKNEEFCALKIVLYRERRDLYERIEFRSEQMVQDGLIDETKTLLNMGYSPNLKPMKAIGYRHMVDFLLKDRPLENVLEQLKRDTRRYAKRQLTWFRKEPETHWFLPDQTRAITEKVQSFIAKSA